MKRLNLLFWTVCQMLAITLPAAAEEFVDKRFYEKFNPISGRGSWKQFTPDSIIEDVSRSYWIQGLTSNDEVIWANEIETKCELLENQKGYIKYHCPDNSYNNGIVEMTITDCYDKWVPCALKAYFHGFGTKGAYWVPDGSRDDSAYDESKPFSYDNNNHYKGCPRVWFDKKTEGCSLYETYPIEKSK